ncbi:MAG TPA: FAD-dependent monooxygenase [Polyangium sp.]|nr:FAD-dependent monooxygenase [Polyangium sp.]
MSEQSTCDVLVVGGGPVGLTMACELRRHGLNPRIIDANAAPPIWSKAAGVAARTMEVWQDMGIVDRALKLGRPMYGANMYSGTERIAHLTFNITGTPFPYIFGLEQQRTEGMLAEHLRDLGGTFERPVKLIDFEQNDEGVTARLEYADGREEKVRCRWLVGCDGAKSTVRHGLNLPFEGSTFEQTLMQADVRVDLPFAVDPNEAVAFVSKDGVAGMLPLLEEGRYRFILLGVDNPPAVPPIELFQELVEQRCPAGTRVYDPAWTISFRFHGRIVPRYRVGRVFLAGDAAHIHSPAGAQGMNLGIQDAYNLAWKLALVDKGVAKPTLLDSYDPERRPIGEGIVKGTDIFTQRGMRFLTLRSPIAEALRNQAISFVLNTGFVPQNFFQSLAQIGVGYPNSPAVGEYHTPVWSTALGIRKDEGPRIGDWVRFAKGPGPGERVPDIELATGNTLFDVLRGTKHVLFLFDGSATTDAGYANLTSIATQIEQRWGEHIVVHVVTPAAEKPAALQWSGSRLVDEDHRLHEHFGCNSESLYLVRPDGYVGYRSQPADEGKLLHYLETIFAS